MSTIDTVARIHIDVIDVPEQLSLHAKIVIQQWLAHAHIAAQKGDLYEAHRLLGLVRAKIGDELACTRPCCEG